MAAARLFHRSIQNTTYFSDHIALSAPAWLVSAAGTMFAISYAHSSHNFLGRYLIYVLLGTFASFLVTVRIIRGPFDKFVSRLPGSTTPRRPCTGADEKPFAFFLLTLAGVALLALATTNAAALLTAAFMAVNAVFFHALQGLTPAGRRIAAQLEDYKKFISEVEADPISRSNSPERVPDKLSEKDAYALAFHLDLGWGEQFVTAFEFLDREGHVAQLVQRGVCGFKVINGVGVVPVTRAVGVRLGAALVEREFDFNVVLFVAQIYQREIGKIQRM
jgi:hypothetical protein